MPTFLITLQLKKRNSYYLIIGTRKNTNSNQFSSAHNLVIKKTNNVYLRRTIKKTLNNGLTLTDLI